MVQSEQKYFVFFAKNLELERTLKIQKKSKKARVKVNLETLIRNIIILETKLNFETSQLVWNHYFYLTKLHYGLGKQRNKSETKSCLQIHGEVSRLTVMTVTLLMFPS